MKKLLLLWMVILISIAGRTQLITQLEYYIDNDPGWGNAYQVSITPDSEIISNFSINLAGVENGMHVLNVRTKSDNNIWGLTQHYPFVTIDISSVWNITRIEYFMDTDPGFGNGIPVSFTPDHDISVGLMFDPELYSDGLHNLYVRVRNEKGAWSITNSAMIYVSSDIPKAITGLEYFIDTDPGIGNGTQISVTPQFDLVKSFNINNDSVPEGLHTLFVRVKNEAGDWSMTNAMNFYAVPVNSRITQMEYFIDTDPGYGNGIAIPVPTGQNINQTFVLNLDGLSKGTHTFFARVKNMAGKWSITSTDQFYLLDLKVFLQGPYNLVNDLMNNSLYTNDVIPLQQPYGQNNQAMWYYPGTEQVTSIPDNNIVDWVLIEMRDAVTATQALPSTVVETRPAFLLKNGSIRNLSTGSLVMMTEDITQNMYIVVYHRNHLGIMTANPVPLSGTDECSYDFTTSSAMVYGGNIGYKQIKTDVWGMISGDGNGSGQVENADKNSVWKLQVGTSGYKSGDFNMNSQVDNIDKNSYWKPNVGKGSQIPGGK